MSSFDTIDIELDTEAFVEGFEDAQMRMEEADPDDFGSCLRLARENNQVVELEPGATYGWSASDETDE